MREDVNTVCAGCCRDLLQKFFEVLDRSQREIDISGECRRFIVERPAIENGRAVERQIIFQLRRLSYALCKRRIKTVDKDKYVFFPVAAA